MGFCFPGHTADKGDLPPRRECAETWHDGLFALMPQVELILAIGRYAQLYHFHRLGRPLPKAMKLEDLGPRLARPRRRLAAGDRAAASLLAQLGLAERRTPGSTRMLLPDLRREVAALVAPGAAYPRGAHD